MTRLPPPEELMVLVATFLAMLSVIAFSAAVILTVGYSGPT